MANSSRRPTESGWDSDDDLLQDLEEISGLSAFPDKNKFKNDIDELDEDALLGSDTEEALFVKQISPIRFDKSSKSAPNASTFQTKSKSATGIQQSNLSKPTRSDTKPSVKSRLGKKINVEQKDYSKAHNFGVDDLIDIAEPEEDLEFVDLCDTNTDNFVSQNECMTGEEVLNIPQAWTVDDVEDNGGAAENITVTTDMSADMYHESDSDTDEEEHSRDRFKSERASIISLKSTSRTNIPENLEISDEQQAQIDEFINQKGEHRNKYGRNHSRVLIQTQGRQQQPETFQVPERRYKRYNPPSDFYPPHNQYDGPRTPHDFMSHSMHTDNQPKKILINPHFRGPVVPDAQPPGIPFGLRQIKEPQQMVPSYQHRPPPLLQHPHHMQPIANPQEQPRHLMQEPQRPPLLPVTGNWHGGPAPPPQMHHFQQPDPQVARGPQNQYLQGQYHIPPNNMDPRMVSQQQPQPRPLLQQQQQGPHFQQPRQGQMHPPQGQVVASHGQLIIHRAANPQVQPRPLLQEQVHMPNPGPHQQQMMVPGQQIHQTVQLQHMQNIPRQQVYQPEHMHEAPRHQTEQLQHMQAVPRQQIHQSEQLQHIPSTQGQQLQQPEQHRNNAPLRHQLQPFSSQIQHRSNQPSLQRMPFPQESARHQEVPQQQHGSFQHRRHQQARNQTHNQSGIQSQATEYFVQKQLQKPQQRQIEISNIRELPRVSQKRMSGEYDNSRTVVPPKVAKFTGQRETQEPEDEETRHLKMQLEQQKIARENVIKRKERNRQAQAERRRLELQKRLAEQGKPIVDGSDGDAHVVIPVQTQTKKTFVPKNTNLNQLRGQMSNQGQGPRPLVRQISNQGQGPRPFVKQISNQGQGPRPFVKQHGLVRNSFPNRIIGQNVPFRHRAPGPSGQVRGQAPVVRGRGRYPLNQNRHPVPLQKQIPAQRQMNTGSKQPTFSQNSQVPSKDQGNLEKQLSQQSVQNKRASKTVIKKITKKMLIVRNAKGEIIRRQVIDNNISQEELLKQISGNSEVTKTKATADRQVTMHAAQQKINRPVSADASRTTTVPDQNVSDGQQGSRTVVAKPSSAQTQEESRTVMVSGVDAGTTGSCTVVINNLSTTSTNRPAIAQLSSRIGPSKSIQVIKSQKKAIVIFHNPEHAALFVSKYNRSMLDLSHLNVKLMPT